jgi:hypothetical protein
MSKDQMILWTRTVTNTELSKIQANLQSQVEQQAAFGARGQSARELIALHLKNFFIRYNSVDRFHFLTGKQSSCGLCCICSFLATLHQCVHV